MVEKIRKYIGFIFIAIGLLLLISPFIFKGYTKLKVDKKIETIIDAKKEIVNNQNPNKIEYENLYNEMKAYNENLRANGQNFTDAFAYKDIEYGLKEYGITENTIGYLEITKLNLQLPIYLGATEENLNKGAALVWETSIPLGEKSSNTVIAAHRGLIRHQMFRNIDKLVLDDEIKITTFWDELKYKVTDLKIISPMDSSEIEIIENEDMVTLITCHPYRINNQRYVVYCKRVNE